MLEFWQRYLHPFLESSFFSSALTVSTAWVAYIIYRRQQKDSIRSAANTVLLEIMKAEKHVGDAKKQYAKAVASNTPSQRFPENLQVMQTDSWTLYRPLLSKNLSTEVVSEIDDFYANCRQFDRALAYLDNTFSKNETEIRAQTYRVIADHFEKSVIDFKDNPTNDPKIEEENKVLMKKYRDFLATFTDTFPKEYSYYPTGPYQDAQYYLELLRPTLSSSRAGDELRSTAEIHKPSTK